MDALLYVHRLQRVGFRFEEDDFPLKFWLDLGVVGEYLEQRRLHQLAMALWGGGEKGEEKD